jgi:hypothetical protein
MVSGESSSGAGSVVGSGIMELSNAPGMPEIEAEN